MSILALENFFEVARAPNAAAAASTDTGAEALEAYERGYQSGWDDALDTATRDQTHIGLELAKNIESMNVSFKEAQRQVCLSLHPLVDALVAQIAPEVLRASLGQTVASLVGETLENAERPELTLTVCPEDAEKLRRALPAELVAGVTFVAEPSLLPGQLRAEAKASHLEIDAHRLIHGLRQAFEQHFDQLRDEGELRRA